jgi:hypothetical protein
MLRSQKPRTMRVRLEPARLINSQKQEGRGQTPLGGWACAKTGYRGTLHVFEDNKDVRMARPENDSPRTPD